MYRTPDKKSPKFPPCRYCSARVSAKIQWCRRCRSFRPHLSATSYDQYADASPENRLPKDTAPAHPDKRKYTRLFQTHPTAPKQAYTGPPRREPRYTACDPSEWDTSATHPSAHTPK